MKVLFYFKKYLLGELTWEDGYVYTSNLEGEKLFKQNSFASPLYPLFNSHHVKLEKLPHILDDILKNANNEYLKRKAKIEQSDSDFVKLYKLSTLPFDDIGFYVKAE